MAIFYKKNPCIKINLHVSTYASEFAKFLQKYPFIEEFFYTSSLMGQPNDKHQQSFSALRLSDQMTRKILRSIDFMKS